MQVRALGRIGVYVWSCVLLAGCGGGGDDSAGVPQQVDTDYSDLKVAEPSDEAMQTRGDAVLELLRNGLRLGASGSAGVSATPVVSASAPQTNAYSDTTVQVEGVDESDLVEYDGHFIYSLISELASPLPGPVVPLPAAGLTLVPGYYWPGYTTTLNIASTNSDDATSQKIGEFKLERRHASRPEMYQVAASAGSRAQYLAVLAQTNWMTRQEQTQPGILPVRPNRVVLELLDVADPTDVSRAWKLEMEGWLRTSRKVGDVVYVVSSYWPTLAALNPTPQSEADRQANERTILGAGADQLLPRVWHNGAESALLAPDACWLPALSSTDAFRELIVVTAINVVERRISDVACLNAGENGVYLSRDSVYIGGTHYARIAPFAPTTVIHKLALNDGQIDYRATGAVAGTFGWSNSSYFMDEHQDDLRVMTTRNGGGRVSHHLTVLREAPGRRLASIATLPNAAHPEPIGKPGEQIRAVRFAGDRGYVVTFLTIDPLYVLDLRVPTDPVIAGALDVPGFSTYLRPIGANHLVGVGQHTDSQGRPTGVKVELFDVRDITQPRSVGAHIFGRSWSEGLFDFHALSFVTLPGASPRYRMAVSLNVYDTPSPTSGWYTWTHTGLHLFEAADLETATPRWRFQGVLKAAQPTPERPWPEYVDPTRSVLHNDAVYYVYGDRILSSVWSDIEP